MKGWLDSNPNKRKTSRGILRFINGWLAREQNRNGSVKNGSHSADAMEDLRQIYRMFDGEGG